MTHHILVTGSSTGIGRAMAESFAAKGAHVFAGVRRESDAPQHPKITPVLIDVTDEAQTAAAVAQISEVVGGRGLTALANNAGVAIGGPLEYIPISEVRRQLEVNVIGQVAVTQAFLPLLRKARDARIVFTGSVSGLVGFPGLGPYAASKHALHGLADSLRRELKPSGIGVSVLVCGTIDTPIWGKGTSDIDAIADTYPPEALERYGRLLSGMSKVIAESNDKGIPPEDVAAVAWKAINARHPKARYLVGMEPKALKTVLALMPRALFDKAVESQLPI